MRALSNLHLPKAFIPGRSVIATERTWISCHAALDKAAPALFRKEGRRSRIDATKFNRKSGGVQ